MEWNAKTLSHGDWDNLMMFNGKTPEIPKQVQLTDWGIEGDGGIDNWSLFSSGGGVCSASDFGNGSSSKSSISVSIDSSSKGGTKISKFSLGVKKKKELGTVEDPQISTTLGASVDSGEPLIGLKLGKRTYFEDVCAGSTSKPTSLSVTPATSATTTKRSRSSYLTPHCQVEGCNLDLSSSKEYHRRHRVCENHAKCPRVIVAGLVRRFCQQCSRFHDLVEFDEKKRSCRRRLSDHNARRRKPLPEAIQFNSPRLSSSFYDGSPHMGLVLNRIPPPVHTSPAANPTWESTCGSSQAKGSLLKSSKGGIDGQMHLPIVDLPNTISTLRHQSDRLFPFKGTTSEVLNQGLEVPVIPSNEDATPDFWRALSLLSNGSWGSGDPEPTSLNRLMHVNHVNTVRPSMHVVSQGYPLTPSEHLHAQQRQTESRMHSSTFQNNGSSQFQQFQLFKTPYESGFYSNQLN